MVTLRPSAAVLRVLDAAVGARVSRCPRRARHVIALGTVAHPQDLAVAQVPDGAVLGPDPGDAQAHGLHRSHHFAGLNHVADAVLVLDGDEDAGQEVADQLLRAEADGHTQNSDAGQQRCDVDVQVLAART